MRFQLLLVTACVLCTANASMRVVRSAHAAIEHRLKRQLEGGSAQASQDALECIERCQPLLEQMSSGGGDSLASLEALVNEEGKEFDPDELPQMCDKFKSAKTCFDECKPNRMVALVTGAFRPLEFMCIEKYNEFVAYQQCLHDAKPGNDEHCEQTCGSEQQILQMMKGFREMENERDITEVLRGMKDVCIFTDCHLTCAQPKIVEACESDVPVQLMRQLMGEAMSMMRNMFAQVGLADMMPQECLSINQTKSEPPTTSAQPPSSSEGNEVTSTERPNDTIQKSTTTTTASSVDSNTVNQQAQTGENIGATMTSSVATVATTVLCLFAHRN